MPVLVLLGATRAVPGHIAGNHLDKQVTTEAHRQAAELAGLGDVVRDFRGSHAG